MLTAVISPSYYYFKLWCRERRILKAPSSFYIDEQGEKYLPIFNEQDASGVSFNSFEIAFEEAFMNTTRKNELINFTKLRTL